MNRAWLLVHSLTPTAPWNARRVHEEMPRLLQTRPSFRSLAAGSNRTLEKKFDVESGQVYSETTCIAGPMTADWVWTTKGRAESIRDFRSNGPGCATLEHMAIRAVIAHSSSLSMESLQDIPWLLAVNIWQQTKKLSVHPPECNDEVLVG